MIEPEIIIGSPGCGKTEALLGLVEDELAAGTEPERIGLLTFTKRGAGEAASRAATKFSLSRTRLRYFRTLHSLCFQAGNYANGDVLEGKKLVEFGDWLGVRTSEGFFSDEGSSFGYEAGDRALFMENLARVRCVPLRQQYDEDCDGLSWSLVDRVSRGLLEFKKSRHLVDYTDMLSNFVAGGWRPELDVLLVDEFQDTSQLQWRAIQKLAETCRRFVIAGDDDQAIYRWAGADVDNFVAMPGRVRVLGQSWRVPVAVQHLALDIISRVRSRRPKEWLARPEKGELARVQRFSDADVEGDDVLILGRNAVVLRPVMEYLRREGAIFEWRGRSSVSGETLEAVVLWERLRSGESVTVDEARRCYALMTSGKGVKRGHKLLPGMRGDDPVRVDDLELRGGLLTRAIWHEALDRLSPEERLYMVRARKKGEKLRSKPRIRVSTIHGAKGGQAAAVVLLRDVAPRTAREALVLREDEARVWYVGATRAQHSLTVVAPRTRFSYDL